MAKSKYYRRKDGLFESIRWINDKRVAFRGKTCREVDRKILAHQEKEERGRTYQEVLDEFWKHKEPEWSASSVSAYLRAYKRIKDELGGVYIKQMRPLDLVRYLQKMKDRGYRAGTVGLDLSLLKMSCSWAVLHGEIDVNPCAEVKRPKGLYSKKREALTPEQIKQVTEYRGEHWLLGLMLLYTGCRRGELLALRYEDIDRKDGVIHIRRKLCYANGNVPYIEERTKTAAGMRRLPLLPILADALPQDRIGLIFHEEDGTPYRSATISRAWREYSKGIGFPVRIDVYGQEIPEITPHCFRHSFATICYEAGVDPKSAAALLGHADEAITMQLYTHLTALHQSKQADKLNAYIAKVKAD